MSRLALMMALAFLVGCSSAGWRAQRIDGNTESSFERSVGVLQQTLPARRREDFEVALAVLWLRSSAAGDGDADSDGLVDVNEMKALQQLSEEVLTDIKRGVLLS